jgi:hypothetical protein
MILPCILMTRHQNIFFLCVYFLTNLITSVNCGLSVFRYGIYIITPYIYVISLAAADVSHLTPVPPGLHGPF